MPCILGLLPYRVTSALFDNNLLGWGVAEVGGCTSALVNGKGYESNEKTMSGNAENEKGKAIKSSCGRCPTT